MNSISMKALLGYLAVLLVSAVAAIFLFSNANNVGMRTERFVDETLPAVSAIEQLGQQVDKLMIASYAFYSTSIDSGQFQSQLAESTRAIEKALGIPALRKDSKAMLQRVATLDNISRQLLDTMSAESIDWDGARETLADMQSERDATHTDLQTIKNTLERDANESAAMIRDDISAITSLVLLMLLAISGVAIGAFWFSRRTISQPISNLANRLTLVAEELDLRTQLSVSGSDEISTASSSVNNLLSSVKSALADVQNVSRGVASASEDMQSHSGNTDQQVVQLNAEIEQLNGRMRDLHSSVEQGLHRSEESYKAAQNGSKAVENGAEQVRQTAGSVVRLAQDIEVSSQQLSELRSTGDQVSSVVGTIAEIAEQTNLLALNAAIEAARAGESGRGFAVVADEVRTLANRTQQSTEEINNMLTALVNAISGVVHSMENNSKQAEQSAQMAQQTVSTLNQIQETILDLSESSRVVAELNTGASENASRIQGQVEEFSTLGSAVQQGSAETKQTASDLSCSVSRLNELVGRFTL
ncbi:methyl-accepting chemotaxis protein [Pseudoteredinibacter isoporae]|uniref:Methyl-accepting chemotaxis protein n=1 Tax=Pseudoteredinibacter isoporae TaxID=570281 RepID=A0A7X0JUZ7_9GAMM|nr:methyl-accepting chemotaxis protein [Pseudoteredinibacter isoporae]NHO88291.1 hypothetical protein [Pseudoteredinibacter isoporae]NIB23378.1 hypothetical protein [Pseudoteredinibacter isoporae]